MSERLNQKLRKIDKLLLSGGSSRGYAYIGLVQYLEETQILNQIKYLVGTSIGSLMATMINLGYSSSEMESVLKTYNYETYQSIDLMSIFDTFGIDTCENTIKFIQMLFTKKGFSPQTTFKTLYETTQIRLVINAVCLNIPSSIFFDYLQFPEMPIVTAIQASMSLPFIFSSVNYQGLTFSDGGILNNFPIDCDIFKCDPETILAISLHNPVTSSIKTITTLEQFSLQILTCVSKLTAGNFTKCPDKAHLVQIKIPKLHVFNLQISNEQKQMLKEAGYQQTKKYFETLLPLKIQTEIEHDKYLDNLKQVEDQKQLNAKNQIQEMLALLASKQYETLKIKLDAQLAYLTK